MDENDTLTPQVVAMVAFITARLDEIEQDAHACNDAPWDPMTWPEATQILVASYAHHVDPMKFRHMGHVATVEHAYDATHIARHDPARVLAHVEATRKIVANACTALDHGWQLGDEAREATAHLAVRILQHLAGLDAAHADYDQAWAL